MVCLLVLFLTFQLAQNTLAAGLDPLIGIRISQYASQTILAAPPLPSLNSSRDRHVTPSISYLTADMEGSVSSDGANSTAYSGSFNGWSVGLGVTRRMDRKWSYFGFAVVNDLQGNIKIASSNSYGGSSEIYLKEMKSRGYSLSTGLNLNLISSDHFALGILGGPFISQFQSQFYFVPNVTASSREKYEATSYTFGAMVGTQVLIKLGKASINPYVLYYRDLSDLCQEFSSSGGGAGPSDDACSKNGTVAAITMDGSFFAYGVNLGIFGLFLNVYSYVPKADVIKSISLHNYAVSYTFDY